MQRTITRFGGESRRKITDPALDLKSDAVEKIANPVGRVFLLESKLGFAVDPVTKVDEIGLNGIQLFLRSRFVIQ